MKFIHLSDLHLGKRVNEYSMLEDQEYILKEIINIIVSEKPDGVIIAGDIYDKAVPSAEAVTLFDNFLFRLSKEPVKVFIISGNHDSVERMSCNSRLIEDSGIYISRAYNGEVTPITLDDEFGKLNIYMLPFIKPQHVRRFYENADTSSYTSAMRFVIDEMHVDEKSRNILVTHQFVTGAKRSESEEINVGTLDNIDASVFKPFDYVALGHIHSPQNIGSETIRYSGTPLKYSFSEVNDKKSVTVIDIKEKGNVKVSTIPLTPLRDMHEIKGYYDDLVKKDFYDNTDYKDAYMHITLLDEVDIVDALGKLRAIYKNLMKLDYDNKRTRSNSVIGEAQDIEQKSPLELFTEFFEKQNNKPMTTEEQEYVKATISSIWEA